jgi:acyl-CoA reductase-like NAD-dependent aldehyde dehydrogenase
MSDTSIANLIKHLGVTATNVAVIKPKTGNTIYELPQQSAEQVADAVKAARLAQVPWAQTPAKERAAWLYALHDLILEEQDKLMDIVQLETGKARAHAYEEVAGGLGAARYYAKVGPKALRSKKTVAGVPVLTKTWVNHVPVGVVGVITPWNYPLALCLLDVLPALMAGNAVVQKSDNQTTLTALFSRHLAIRAGLDPALWTVVAGDGATVGNALTDSADYIAFTGSAKTGAQVGARAAARLIPFSLELGGKNPMIILDSAKLDFAAETLIGGAFGSAGQLCVSIERAYIPNHLKDEFLAVLKEKVESLKLGNSNDFSMDIGTLTGANQLARVQGFVADATSKGANVITGGHPLADLGPYYYAPTIVTGVTSNMNMFDGEVFGPVVAVFGYDNIKEDITLANDTTEGLNASVVGNKREAAQVASQIMAGTVNINEGFRATFASLDSPMGGMKQSGHGRRNGVEGLLKYTEAQTIGIHQGLLNFPWRGNQYNRMAPLLNLLSKILRRL